MANIHPLSVVDPKAELAQDVEVGPFCTIGPNVKVGAGTRLISHVVLDGYTTIGERNTIYPHASLGMLAQHKRSNAPDAVLIIGDDNVFREGVTVHVGSDVDNKITRVGSRGWFLAYSHIAHDCIVGDDVIMSNLATLAGHVKVENRAIIGGLAAVAQFARVGEGAMIGGTAGIAKDVIPFGIVSNTGTRSGLGGLNLIGLQRAGVEKEKIFELQKAYKLLFDKEAGGLPERIAAIEAEAVLAANPLVQKVLIFAKGESKNGLLQPEG